MTLEELTAIIAETAREVEADPGMLRFVHDGIPMACLCDPSFDRMRIIAAIVDADELDEEVKDQLLEANFHTALDARYAISRKLLFAAFIHPLSSLDRALLRSALDQVASLVHTFGGEFSGGTLEFVRGSTSTRQMN